MLLSPDIQIITYYSINCETSIKRSKHSFSRKGAKHQITRDYNFATLREIVPFYTELYYNSIIYKPKKNCNYLGTLMY